MAEKFIQKAIKRPGQLHRDLGIPQGQKIPAETLRAAAKRPGVVGRRARFAMMLRSLHGSGPFSAADLRRGYKICKEY